MKTLEEIEQALREWQEADPEGRSVSLLTVRTEGTDAEGDPERIISGAMGGDTVALTAAHYNQMLHNDPFRRIILAAMMGYVDHQKKNASFDDEEEAADACGTQNDFDNPA